ncbi:nitroreductase/quinone reductase family protein [Asanoa iriomotensis]|uniref:nitroreductase/quinone reductase family protein n=1 Tax=Asanoa iriomotensis TaxID=234613 RepID=UPI001EF325E6|nr:nitroreductase/quinone reductase family protein [Asanoa iriomotensis]
MHRGIYRGSGGRLGLSRPRGNKYGLLRLTTTGRRTGRERGVIVAYLLDGPRYTTLAMNGWGEPEPAWWLNLKAHPEARIDLGGGPQPIRARAASGDERVRLWELWSTVDKNLDGYAALRSRETAVVVFEPL